MNVLSRQPGGATIEVADDELLAIHQAFNEVCHALDPREFQTRMGYTLDFVKALMNEVGDAYHRSPDE